MPNIHSLRKVCESISILKHKMYPLYAELEDLEAEERALREFLSADEDVRKEFFRYHYSYYRV